MSTDTQPHRDPADTDIRGERTLKGEDTLHRYAPYELSPEKLFRILSRRHLIAGNSRHLYGSGRRRRAGPEPLADAFETAVARD